MYRIYVHTYISYKQIFFVIIVHFISAPRWNKHRRLINPAFSRQNINNFLPIFNVEANLMLGKCADLAKSGEKFNIYEMLKRSVLETACRKYYCNYEQELFKVAFLTLRSIRLQRGPTTE